MAFAKGRGFVILNSMAEDGNPDAQRLLKNLKSMPQDEFDAEFTQLLGSSKGGGSAKGSPKGDAKKGDAPEKAAKGESKKPPSTEQVDEMFNAFSNDKKIRDKDGVVRKADGSAIETDAKGKEINPAVRNAKQLGQKTNTNRQIPNYNNKATDPEASPEEAQKALQKNQALIGLKKQAKVYGVDDVTMLEMSIRKFGNDPQYAILKEIKEDIDASASLDEQAKASDQPKAPKEMKSAKEGIKPVENYPTNPMKFESEYPKEFAARVQELEEEGMDNGDAQGVAMAEVMTGEFSGFFKNKAAAKPETTKNETKAATPKQPQVDDAPVSDEYKSYVEAFKKQGNSERQARSMAFLTAHKDEYSARVEEIMETEGVDSSEAEDIAEGEIAMGELNKFFKQEQTPKPKATGVAPEQKTEAFGTSKEMGGGIGGGQKDLLGKKSALADPNRPDIQAEMEQEMEDQLSGTGTDFEDEEGLALAFETVKKRYANDPQRLAALEKLEAKNPNLSPQAAQPAATPQTPGVAAKKTKTTSGDLLDFYKENKNNQSLTQAIDEFENSAEPGEFNLEKFQEYLDKKGEDPDLSDDQKEFYENAQSQVEDELRTLVGMDRREPKQSDDAEFNANQEIINQRDTNDKAKQELFKQSDNLVDSYKKQGQSVTEAVNSAYEEALAMAGGEDSDLLKTIRGQYSDLLRNKTLRPQDNLRDEIAAANTPNKPISPVIDNLNDQEQVKSFVQSEAKSNPVINAYYEEFQDFYEEEDTDLENFAAFLEVLETDEDADAEKVKEIKDIRSKITKQMQEIETRQGTAAAEQGTDIYDFARENSNNQTISTYVSEFETYANDGEFTLPKFKEYLEMMSQDQDAPKSQRDDYAEKAALVEAELEFKQSKTVPVDEVRFAVNYLIGNNPDIKQELNTILSFMRDSAKNKSIETANEWFLKNGGEFIDRYSGDPEDKQKMRRAIEELKKELQIK